ncbi:predicted protein, partial [Arabidopsis lyrata subsp. lyrata]
SSHASYGDLVVNGTNFLMGVCNVQILHLSAMTLAGFNHKNTVKCLDVDGCICKSSAENPTCLSSSPVKVLKILKFGEICDDKEMQMELVEHFLETMPKLEQMILYYDTPLDEDVIEVSKQLEKLSRVASANCKIQIISDNLSLSSSLFTTGLILFKNTFPV